MPRWWGITIANKKNGSVSLSLARAAKLNPSPDPLLIAKLLLKSEAIAILEQLGLDKGWRGKAVVEVRQRLASILNISDLRARVREMMKARHRGLGQDASSNLDVTINAVPNPDGEATRRQCSGSYLIDTAAAPAMGKETPRSKNDNALCMPEELSIHWNRARYRCSNSSAYQKLGLKRVAAVMGYPHRIPDGAGAIETVA